MGLLVILEVFVLFSKHPVKHRYYFYYRVYTYIHSVCDSVAGEVRIGGISDIFTCFHGFRHPV